jgi:hypothetical protein
MITDFYFAENHEHNHDYKYLTIFRVDMCREAGREKPLSRTLVLVKSYKVPWSIVKSPEAV